MTEAQYYQQYMRNLTKLEKPFAKQFRASLNKMVAEAASAAEHGQPREAEKIVRRFEAEQKAILQSRYVSDMAIIWKLQPRFLVRSRRAAMKLLQHPRFRAAYDFLLLRASSGDASHELADWWTAYEGATDEERLEMSKEAEQQD